PCCHSERSAEGAESRNLHLAVIPSERSESRNLHLPALHNPLHRRDIVSQHVAAQQPRVSRKRRRHLLRRPYVLAIRLLHHPQPEPPILEPYVSPRERPTHQLERLRRRGCRRLHVPLPV